MAAAIPIALAVVGGGFGIAGGFAADKAAKKEANALRDEGILLEQESVQEGKRRGTEIRKFAKSQKLAFISSGVVFSGSPLLVTDETLTLGQEEVNSIVRRGTAQKNLAFQRADITRRRGRAELINSFSAAFTNTATATAGSSVFSGGGGGSGGSGGGA